MSKGVELVLVTRQETVILPKVELIVAEGVLVAIRMRYKPIFNQQNGSIVKRVPRD
jgi:hypothetical protein